MWMRSPIGVMSEWCHTYSDTYLKMSPECILGEYEGKNHIPQGQMQSQNVLFLRFAVGRGRVVAHPPHATWASYTRNQTWIPRTLSPTFTSYSRLTLHMHTWPPTPLPYGRKRSSRTTLTCRTPLYLTFPVFLMCTSTPLTRFPSSWCRLPVLATLLTHPVSHLAPLRTLSLLHLLSSRRT